MLERMQSWFRRRRRREAAANVPEERSSGEEAVATVAGASAEATPSGMPRVKTEKL